jgi:hypothetical protein
MMEGRSWESSSFDVKREHAESKRSNRGRKRALFFIRSVPVNYSGCKDRKKRDTAVLSNL